MEEKTRVERKAKGEGRGEGGGYKDAKEGGTRGNGSKKSSGSVESWQCVFCCAQSPTMEHTSAKRRDDRD